MEFSTDLRLLCEEKVASNAKVAVVEDIDDDGVAELIVGTTDRFVRIYKWSIENGELSLLFLKFWPVLSEVC